MASETDKQQVKDKLDVLVKTKFDGDVEAAFAYYDINNDGKIDRSELMDLLTDAGVGNWFTRGRWADGILAELDKDNDGAITPTDLPV
jgi:Ca2+-binding EF-hand superfamily protein